MTLTTKARAALLGAALALSFPAFAAPYAVPAPAKAAVPATVRLDYLHTGNALNEQYSIDRVVIEPLPWAGKLSRNLDDTDRGVNRVEVVDAKTGDLLYSRGFSTIFGEWRSTEEAQKTSRGFQESVRFPKPDRPVKVRILKRDERNAFSVVWSVEIDTDAQDVVRKQEPAPAKPIPIRVSGPSPDKVDLLIMGDGYTKADMHKFEAGTGNIADAVGLGAAIDYVNKIGIENIARYEHDLLVYGTQQLAAIKGVRLIGTARDKASVLSFVLEGYSTEEVGLALAADLVV
eukprot:gene32162-36307_t